MRKQLVFDVTINRIKVPSKQVLAHIMMRTNRDYTVAFSDEVIAFCNAYLVYFERVSKGNTPEAAWHKAAEELAQEDKQ